MHAAIPYVVAAVCVVVLVCMGSIAARECRRIDRERDARIAQINAKFVDDTRRTLYTYRTVVGPQETAKLAAKLTEASKLKHGDCDPVPGYYALLESFMDGVEVNRG